MSLCLVSLELIWHSNLRSLVPVAMSPISGMGGRRVPGLALKKTPAPVQSESAPSDSYHCDHSTLACLLALARRAASGCD